MEWPVLVRHSRWRKGLPWFGISVVVVAALAVFAASALVPDDAAWWATPLAAVGGLAVGFVLEHLADWALEASGRRRQVAGAVRALRVRAPQGVATLLSPHRAVEIGLPMLGRDTQMAELLGWCTSPGTPFRLITGPGGVGKTRLADELLRRLRGSDRKWECVFLSAGQDARPGLVATLREHAGEQRPVLVVVDYAENRPDLRGLLEDAFQDAGTMRVLLLARRAGNWWDKLTDIPGGLGAALQEGYPDSDLPDVAAEPQTIVDHAAAAFAAHLGVPVPRVQFARPGRLRVLDLTAIALITVLDAGRIPEHSAVTSPMTVDQVFTELLRHEADRYWQATAREVDLQDTLTVAMRRVLVAAVALLGPADEPSTVALVGRVLATFPDDTPPDIAAAARWLRNTYPPADGAGRWVEPLTPDRVAEHLVVQTLTVTPRPVARRVAALLAELPTDQAVHAMTVLSRTATDPARNHNQRATVRVFADYLADHLPGHHPTVARVLDAIPWPSVTMASTAVDLARTQLELLDDTPEADKEQIADAADQLGIWFWELGRPDQALPHTKRAVDLYKRLAQSDPDRHEPSFARSLNNLGNRLAELGRSDEALPVTRRAVDLYGRLAQSDPDRHEPGLARSLHNLGNRFSALGQPDQALPPAQRAVDLFERLAQTSPDHHQLGLAWSLNNLGVRLAELGRPGEALLITRRAVEIREWLARTNPDRYEPGLAMSLNNLGARFSELGRPYEALSATQHAVDLFERLAQASPDRHEPDLAMSLKNLGARFSELGRQNEALPIVERAVDLFGRAARQNPARYQADHQRVHAFLNDLRRDNL